MSNYNQYYYKGDTINARVVEDGFALDLTDDNVRSKVYDDEYRLGLAKQLNSLYKRKFGRESGISDNSVSLEILGHAAGYDFATGLNGKVDAGSFVLNPVLFATINNPIARDFRNDLYNATKEANIGKNDGHRKGFDAAGKIFY